MKLYNAILLIALLVVSLLGGLTAQRLWECRKQRDWFAEKADQSLKLMEESQEMGARAVADGEAAVVKMPERWPVERRLRYLQTIYNGSVQARDRYRRSSIETLARWDEQNATLWKQMEAARDELAKLKDGK